MSVALMSVAGGRKAKGGAARLARHVDAIGDDATQTEGELLELDGLLGAKEHARVDRGPAAQPLQGKRQEPHTCGGGDEVPVAREVIPNTARMGLHAANDSTRDSVSTYVYRSANTAARWIHTRFISATRNRADAAVLRGGVTHSIPTCTSHILFTRVLWCARQTAVAKLPPRMRPRAARPDRHSGLSGPPSIGLYSPDSV